VVSLKQVAGDRVSSRGKLKEPSGSAMRPGGTVANGEASKVSEDDVLLAVRAGVELAGTPAELLFMCYLDDISGKGLSYHKPARFILEHNSKRDRKANDQYCGQECNQNPTPALLEPWSRGRRRGFE
jgi:hypothetical protein